MKPDHFAPRTAKEVFDRYSPGDDYEFARMLAPVGLAQSGSQKLVSRSEAKRLLARASIWVFALSRPEILILPLNAMRGSGGD